MTNLGLAEITDQLSRLGFRLRRSWPRGPERLLLDLEPVGSATASEPVAGQWFAAPGRAGPVAAATPGATATGPFVLHPGGADRRLPAVAGRLRRTGTRLIGHRPERRAVLREADGSFTKFVRRERWPGLVATAKAAESLPLPTSRVLAADPVAGSVTTAPLPGRTLTDLLAAGSGTDACHATGRALAALHRVDPGAIPNDDPAGVIRTLPSRHDPLRDLPIHDLSAEVAVTETWQRHARDYRAPLRFRPPPIPRRSPATEPIQLTLVHRDLHDGQVLIDDHGRAGLLDFDLLAIGDPALDLANLIAHLELRADQGLVPDPAPLIAAVLAGYDPTPALASRLPTYRALTRRRLAAVYAFRPPPPKGWPKGGA